MIKLMALISVAALSLALSSPAQAGPILTVGNSPQAGDENVLLNTGDVGNPVYGLTNQTGRSVRFLSNETLVAPANGQARILAQDGLLACLDISIPGSSFMSLVLDLDAMADGTVDFKAYDTGGNLFLFPNIAFDGKGNNFFTFTTDGLAFSHIAFSTDAPMMLIDAQQFRIGSAGFTPSVTSEVSAVPEPVTLLMVGSGLIGCASRMRRKGARG